MDEKKADGRRKVKQAAEELWQILICFYFVLLFVVFPFYYKNRYSGMGDHKYEFFLVITLGFVGAALVAGVFYAVCFGREILWKKSVFRMSSLDWFVGAYLVCALFSFVLSADRKAAFLGADGWFMGLLSQFLFVGVYFIISRSWRRDDIVFVLICAASAGVFLLGILHRFQIDPLGMYEGIGEEYKVKFLSTIGQATWYSSFLCTLFPLGCFLFWYSRDVKVRIFSGIYSAAAFATLVTQNSDSAFFALGAVLLILFWKSFDSAFWGKRFLEVLLLVLGSFVTMGTLQLCFSERAVKLDSLSVFLSQSMAMWILFAAAILVYACYDKWIALAGWEEGIVKRIKRAVFIMLAVSAGLLLFFFVLNSGGLLERWFGFTFQHNYLYFDESWGNNRGFNWMFSAAMIRDFSPKQIFFGVGPDSFSAYAYSAPQYAAILDAKWPGSTLTCAHNEILNALVCYGIAGTAAYIGIFSAGIHRFFKHFEDQPIVFAVGLCMASYLAHNFFCYQQVVCAPFLFALMGMAENIVRRKKEEEIV